MEGNPKLNQHCPVCKTNINFLKKKVECSNCKLLVCKNHSVKHENSNHFCDLCEKSIIKTTNFSDLIFQINSLKADLEYIKKDKNKYKKTIMTKNEIIARLEKQYKTSQMTHQEKVDAIERKIEQEHNKQISENKLIEHLEQSLLESRKSEEVMMEKLNFLMQDFNTVNIENQELLDDQKFLLSKLDNINLELRGVAPINRLRLISCCDCYVKIKADFFEVYRTASILEGNESFTSRASQVLAALPETIEKKGCAACIIF